MKEERKKEYTEEIESEGGEEGERHSASLTHLIFGTPDWRVTHTHTHHPHKVRVTTRLEGEALRIATIAFYRELLVLTRPSP